MKKSEKKQREQKKEKRPRDGSKNIFLSEKLEEIVKQLRPN